jgi:protein-S-isoprenylcysteine O-methyltransferase Ste14
MLFFVLSYLAIVRVFRENTFAASTIAVEPGQKLISTGPHAHVRHPMYAAGILLLAASPLSFGSWWGLTVFIPLFWRLLDEEKFLMPSTAAARSPDWRLSFGDVELPTLAQPA